MLPPRTVSQAAISGSLPKVRSVIGDDMAIRQVHLLWVRRLGTNMSPFIDQAQKPKYPFCS